MIVGTTRSRKVFSARLKPNYFARTGSQHKRMLGMPSVNTSRTFIILNGATQPTDMSARLRLNCDGNPASSRYSQPVHESGASSLLARLNSPILSVHQIWGGPKSIRSDLKLDGVVTDRTCGFIMAKVHTRLVATVQPWSYRTSPRRTSSGFIVRKCKDELGEIRQSTLYAPTICLVHLCRTARG